MRLRRTADALLSPKSSQSQGAVMSPLSLAVSTVVALSAGLLLAAAYYAEAHRAPDQP